MPDQTTESLEDATSSAISHNESQRTWTWLLFVIGIVIVFFALLATARYTSVVPNPFPAGVSTSTPPTDNGAEGSKATDQFTRFKSAEHYAQYMAAAESADSPSFGASRRARTVEDDGALEQAAPGVSGSNDGSSAQPERHSSTNVQVKGIDEPDIVKTNGTHLFLSQEGHVEPMSRPEAPRREDVDYRRPEQKTSIVRAFPVDQLAAQGKIDKQGDLLLHDDTLVMFSGNSIHGFDVSDTQNPQEKWSMTLADEAQMVQARMLGSDIYVVARTRATPDRGCPVPFYTSKQESVAIPCTDVYHPERVIPADSTYTAFKMDPATGSTSERVSFIGSDHNTTIYMSPNAMYVGYQYQTDRVAFFHDFMSENTELFPSSVRRRVANLREMDISQRAKQVELQHILAQWKRHLSDDENLRAENEMRNRMDKYVKAHMRELTTTDIVKIGIDSFDVAARGTVPGTLLNQFSMDEHDGHLRVATTIGESSFGDVETENDVYVLDGNLSIVGNVQGLGLDQRVYSARFLQDTGYVVTYRQIDPFYVLDLRDPKNPTVEGELKLPGYSSYLHPISSDTVLGVGEEDGDVKISLFDVSDPTNPTEAANYILDARWSEVNQTHHAFTLDDKHTAFFIPASNGGFVFSYEGQELTMKKAVSGVNAKRAVYINDMMYIIGSNNVVVLDETTWNRVKELEL